ncbi:MAG: hypothetical protein PF590_01270 [Candidatus Delongbacteria bacterium]|jgi:hypothetical protein|nr:hypothetical protein [Candidatus Delongbacteria bacterium]
MIAPVKISDDGFTAYLSGPSAVVSFPETTAKASRFYHLPHNLTGKPWSYWGADDKRPQNILENVSKNVVASSGLQWLVDAFYSGGIVTYKKVLENGKENLYREDFPEFEEFKKMNDLDMVMEASITDHMYFKMPLIEFYLGRGNYSKKIVQVLSLDASFSRWEKMDPMRRSISKLYYSAQFPNPKKDQVDFTNVYDPANPYRFQKFVLRPSYFGPGRVAYPWAAWHSIVDSGWLEISNNIPVVKQSLLKNNMSIKYHIKIPKTYWSDKYKGWDQMKADKQKELRQEEMQRMNTFLTGKDNVMKAFFSHYGIDRQGKAIPGWEIIKIDNSIADGTLSVDQSEANAMILFGLNIDPTLKGAGLPNTKNSAGSGSDKREAKEIFISNLGLQRKKYLNWLHFLKNFNGWDKSIEFGFKDTILTTLDANPTGIQKSLSE